MEFLATNYYNIFHHSKYSIFYILYVLSVFATLKFKFNHQLLWLLFN